MNRRRLLSTVAASGITLLVIGCTPQKPAPAADTRAADEAAIRASDAAWSQAAKSADGMLSFYADDATVLAPNAPMASDGESRRKVIAELYAIPGIALSWQATKVEVARSGDIGYSLGTYEMTANDANGKPFSDRGKYTTIWRKQADGNWKVVVDMFNTDLPATAPAPQPAPTPEKPTPEPAPPDE
jgi:ketosteroid isomerase-like protein